MKVTEKTMKKGNDIKLEIEKTLSIANTIKKVESPDGIYSGVMVKLTLEEKSTFSYAPLLKWAAVALLVLMNTISYVSFMNEDTEEPNVSINSEIEIEQLVSEYQITEFAYNEY
ncbi:MAG: hypothetical protein NWS46_02965 [Cyclobacteriaceae bacterium]|jgi:hypothetical protein|nr:hypothetical protein [Cyclobacteriaceae bacterium]